MRPIRIGEDVWRVVGVDAGDPRLVDREGKRTVGTADPTTRTIHLSLELVPPHLDKVLLHETAHAVTISHGLLESLHAIIPERYWVPVEEWAVQLVENHAIEATVLASESIGRPLCIGGWCSD